MHIFLTQNFFLALECLSQNDCVPAAEPVLTLRQTQISEFEIILLRTLLRFLKKNFFFFFFIPLSLLVLELKDLVNMEPLNV